MALLPFSRCDTPAPEGECEFLFATAEALLAVAVEGLAPFIPPADCGDTFDTYVSMNPPIAEWYDALSIHLTAFGARQVRGIPEFGVFPPQRAEWDMRLWENQYPVMRDDRVPLPEHYNAVNAHVYAHGLAMHQALVGKKVLGALGLPPVMGETVIGDLTPLGGSGGDAGAVGWSIKITTMVGP